MPPKSLTRRSGARSVAVSTRHPANVAAAAAKKAAGGGKMHPANVVAAAPKKTAGGGNAIAVSTRESPPRASKIVSICVHVYMLHGCIFLGENMHLCSM